MSSVAVSPQNIADENAVVYYLPTVLVSNVGLDPSRAQLIAGFIQIMFPLGNTLPALALDKMGRKKTMVVGCSLLSFCMMMITIVSKRLGFVLPATDKLVAPKCQHTSNFICFCGILLPVHAHIRSNGQRRPLGMGA